MAEHAPNALPGNDIDHSLGECSRWGDLRALEMERLAALLHRDDGTHHAGEHDRRSVGLAENQPPAAAVAPGPVEVGDRLAVGLAQLRVEHGAVVVREVDARLACVAQDLPQTTGRRLEDEVVGARELAGQDAREQARAIPALCALVHEEDHTMGRRRIVQPVKGVDLILRRL